MADNYLITGYHGTPHVTAENDRGIHAAIFGAGRFVLPVGQQFKAEYIGNNKIRLYDGKLMDNGAAAGIPAGEYVDLTISNAGQGMKRNDLIVFQYSQDTSTLVETGSFVVVQGTETNGTAADPTLSQGDLLTGTATLDQMPLWRVSVSGATISAPIKLFEVAKAIPDLQYTKADVGLGNVDNVKQYSASNPPPYPVTSVNGKTGDVQETDPTVPAWAKAASKPTYTAQEIGALPTTGGRVNGSVEFSGADVTRRVIIGSNIKFRQINYDDPWGVGMILRDRDDTTTLGGYGFMKAEGDTLDYYYIGPKSDSALFKMLPDGAITLAKALPVKSGGTGATTPAEALKNLGIFIQADEPTDAPDGAFWIKLAE